MNLFVQQHAKSVMGIIRGWDRLRFRGTVRMLANLTGMNNFLSYTHHKLKDFGDYAQQVSRQVRSASLEVAESAGRPVVPLDSPRINKEQVALEIAKRDGIKEGLIAVVTAVESCPGYDVRSDRQRGLLELYPRPRKCQHLYHYMIHPVFGLLYARLQTWFPFNLFVGLNGREWLARQMDAAGIKYLRHDNCFPWISDPEAAQRLLEKQVQWNWEQTLGELARQVNPALAQIIGGYRIGYYWSLDQSEWASDVMFKQSQELDRLYPDLVRHAMESFRSPQVMSFLGRRVDKGITPRFAGEVISDLHRRIEGTRVKHCVNRNSVKMYNKAGSVLRVETMLNDVRDLQSPRVVGGGEFLINGFRNRDVQAALFGSPAEDPTAKRRRSGQVTRKLRLLRAHGLIQKVPHTHRYLVSSKGRQVIAALHAAKEADIHKLSKAA